MTKTLYILGAGGHGKVVADAAIKMNKWDEIFLLDDQKKGQQILGILVKDSISEAIKYKNENTEFIIGIGDNATRQKIQKQLEENNCRIATIIHPNAIIGSDVSIGQGAVIFAGVVVNPSVTIGEGCILNTSSSIDHDCRLGKYVHLSPGVSLAGNVVVGSISWLGINTTVIQNIRIPQDTIIGGGTVVVRELIDKGVYVGNPARRIK